MSLTVPSLFLLFRHGIKKDKAGEKASALLIASAVFAALSFFSKQSAVVLGLVYLTWFIRVKQYRLLMYWMGSYFLTVVIMLAIISKESGLNSFFQNTVSGINNGVSFYWYCHTIVKEFYSQFGLLWVPALVVLLFSLPKEKERSFHFLATTLIISFVFSNLIAFKWGSSPGYFTEWVALIFIGLAHYAGKAPATISNKIVPACVAIILFVKVLLIFYPLWNMVRPGSRERAMGQYRREELLASVVKSRLQNNGHHTVFNNIYSPELYLNNLLFRNSVMPQFEVVAFGTWNNKVFDYTNFRREITNGSVQMLVCKTGSELQFMDIPLTNFHLVDTFYRDYYIYEYKP